MERLHIAFFGPVNSGKSTLVNAICGQEVSLVSPIPGTTTDPVRKAVEIPGLGPCVLIDTAGLDDVSVLGPERERRTRAILDEADIAVMVVSPEMGQYHQKGGINDGSVPVFGTVPSLIEAADIPVIPSEASVSHIPVVTYHRGESVEELLERIRQAVPTREERFLTGNLVKPGDKVVLVMPQDSEAPKGRLILPQVQVLRELLDRGCIPVCCTPERLQQAMETNPDLVITDSQVFKQVNAAIPASCPLTSFSILLAAAKGDIKTFVEGARAINSLKPGDRVLIAEACTHVPDTEDIGRVKIPALLRRKFCHSERSEESIQVDIAAGNDFPEDLSAYSLIIHCGACVASARLVRARIKKALRAGVPITNYGIAIAALQGILDRVEIPGLGRE
ncbi:MAG: [Bacteroidales bacterium]|nr:[FeFe] hydrogenase H-cluster maturation GTPase HydF [Bacteroidales bacterium]